MLLVWKRRFYWELSCVGMCSPIVRHRRREEVIRLARAVSEELGEPIFAYDDDGTLIRLDERWKH